MHRNCIDTVTPDHLHPRVFYGLFHHFLEELQVPLVFGTCCLRNSRKLRDALLIIYPGEGIGYMLQHPFLVLDPELIFTSVVGCDLKFVPF